MSVLSDIIKANIEEVVTSFAEDNVSLVVGGITYAINCVVTNPVEMLSENGNFEIAQKSKKFTFVKPTGVTIDRNSYIMFESKKWNLLDVSNGYGNVTECTGICDQTQMIKPGITKLGR